MDNQAAPAPAPESAQAQASEGAEPSSSQGQHDPAEALMAVSNAMTEIGKGLAGNIPKEISIHLENALKEYNAFLAGMGKSLGMKMGDVPAGPSQVSDMAGPNAAPAGPVMGGSKNISPA